MGKVDQGVFTHWMVSHYFGRDLEKNLGTGKFLLLYLSSAIAGVAVQFMAPSRMPIGGGTAAGF